MELRDLIIGPRSEREQDRPITELRDLIFGPRSVDTYEPSPRVMDLITARRRGVARPGLMGLITGTHSAHRGVHDQRAPTGVMGLITGRPSVRRQARYELRQAQRRQQAQQQAARRRHRVDAAKERILTRRSRRDGAWRHFWEAASGASN